MICNFNKHFQFIFRQFEIKKKKINDFHPGPVRFTEFELQSRQRESEGKRVKERENTNKYLYEFWRFDGATAATAAVRDGTFYFSHPSKAEAV